MEGQDRPIFKLAITKRALVAVVALLLFAALAVSGFMAWKANQSRPLLPDSIARQITGFTPYFFYDEIPGGYSLDEKSISFDDGIVIIPLTKPGSPPVVLTEQPLPDNLSPDLLQEKESEKVKNTAAPAIINKVEGRLVGIMTSREHRLLLLINAPGNLHTEDIAELLQGLKPTK